jgi:hypothetical protein
MIGQQLWQRSFWDRVFRKEEINGHGACPTYLYRWTLLRLGPIAVYLHHFVGDDWSRDFHDHPKRFITIGLWGRYREETPALWPFKGKGIHDYRAPWIRTFPAEHQHRIIARNCWTLVIVGPKVREWGFWHRGSFIPWRQYVDDRELVEKVRSCQ